MDLILEISFLASQTAQFLRTQESSMRIFIKRLHSRFPIPEIKMSTLIYRFATSMLGVFTITAAAAVYQINPKGKAQSFTPSPHLLLRSPLL